MFNLKYCTSFYYLLTNCILEREYKLPGTTASRMDAVTILINKGEDRNSVIALFNSGTPMLIILLLPMDTVGTF